MNKPPGRASAGALALLIASCGFDQVDKPPPPDTSAEHALLEDPDGRFQDSEDASEVFEALADASQGVRTLCGYDPLSQMDCLREAECRRCAVLTEIADAVEKVLAALDAQDDAGTPSEGGTIPGLAGLLEVDVTCKGHDGSPTPDPDNGSVHLTIGFTGRGLDSTSWGTFDDCATLVEGLPVRLTGEFVLDFDADAVRLADLDSSRALFVYRGRVEDTTLGVVREAQTILYQRIDGQGPFALGLGTRARGTFVLRIASSGTQLEASGGTFTCDSTEATCALDD